MRALNHFKAIWDRCALLGTLQAYLVKNASGVLQPDELLRAEWVSRVSALDLYVHELVAQAMLEIFQGRRSPTPAYLSFKVSTETLGRVVSATTSNDASAAFDLYVRTYLGRITFQEPDDIADAVRLFSPVELWNAVALERGATPATKADRAKAMKRQLSFIVQRRNKIAHEGDLQQFTPREPYPITQSDLTLVKAEIESLVSAIDKVV